MGHGRAPGVKDGGHADARAQMSGIGRDGLHRLGGCLEQQILEQRLVGEGDHSDLGGEREHDVEVAHRQELHRDRLGPWLCAARSARNRAGRLTSIRPPAIGSHQPQPESQKVGCERPPGTARSGWFAAIKLGREPNPLLTRYATRQVAHHCSCRIASSAFGISSIQKMPSQPIVYRFKCFWPSTAQIFALLQQKKTYRYLPRSSDRAPCRQ